MKRVLVIGSCGAGKSTFSRELQRITGLPLLPLDRYYWKPNWAEPGKAEWRLVVSGLIAGNRWIIDGNYGGTMKMRLKRADTLLWLDMPRCLCLYRVLIRMAFSRSRGRPDMADGCDERFDPEFIRYVWNFRRDKNTKIERLIGNLPPQVRMERFSERAGPRRFLDSIAERRAASMDGKC